MANKGHSERGLFGDIYHYDSNGKKIGTSSPGIFGGYTNYDSKGHKVGHSDPGIFGGYSHYDNHGKKIGSSDPGVFGSYNHYDSNHKSSGSSSPNLTGGYSHSSSQGCYVATCVYGSYDCPEVWTLRRFRDSKLASTPFGRTFIKAYYAISPTIVKWFGETKTFKSFWKKRLDKFIENLQNKGYESTPYRDRNYK